MRTQIHFYWLCWIFIVCIASMNNSKSMISKLIIQNSNLGNCFEIDLMWMSQNLTSWEVNTDSGDKSVPSGNSPWPEPMLHQFCNWFKIQLYFPMNNWSNFQRFALWFFFILTNFKYFSWNSMTFPWHWSRSVFQWYFKSCENHEQMDFR